MQLNELFKIFPPQDYPHAKAIASALRQTGSTKKIVAKQILDAYTTFRAYISLLDPTKDMDLICNCYDAYAKLIIQLNNNGTDKALFTAQSKLEPSLLEELFLYIVGEAGIRNIPHPDFATKVRINGNDLYTYMQLSSDTAYSFIDSPQMIIHTKDADIALSVKRRMVLAEEGKTIIVTKTNSKLVNMPLLAGEAKTYIDKTMFDTIVSTSTSVKQGNPHCPYFVLCSGWSVDTSIDPKNTAIDGIYILNKKRTRSRRGIDFDESDPTVLTALSNDVSTHLVKHRNNILENIRRGVIQK